MRKYFYAAGLVLPVVLVWEMVVHMQELTAIMRLAVPKEETTRLLAAEAPALNISKKPLFVLHIGPSKTATTTIQAAAAQNYELLEQDNFYFLGNDWHRPEWDLHEFMRLCFDIDAAEECAKEWSDFGQIIESHYQQNHNVFLSEEMISLFSNDEVEQKNLWRHLERILKNKWQVRIVHTYRRYHQWLPSKYHQAFQTTGPSHNQVKREEWPDNGGRPIPSFPRNLAFMLYKDTFRLPPAAVKRWAAHYPNVHVFNYHQEGDMLENFFCQTIPEATTICKHFGEQKVSKDKVINSSSKKTLHFDMIAVRAYTKGWIVDKNLTRKDVTAAVEVHANKHNLVKVTDFPLECFPANHTKELFRQALEYEAELVPEFFASPRGEKELRAQLAQAVENSAFCSIDVRETLQQKEVGWDIFFKSLHMAENGTLISDMDGTIIDTRKKRAKAKKKKQREKKRRMKKRKKKPVASSTKISNK